MTQDDAEFVTHLASAAAVGTAVYGLVRFTRWWRARPRPAVGYIKGKSVALMVVDVDGKPVELKTAEAFQRMRAAAAKEGVQLKVVSGFRTMAEQEYLYDCYVRCACNNCNLAAKPGYSNHQSGHALDLNTRDPAVNAWLRAHARAFGFTNTVASEPWHWEFWEERG